MSTATETLVEATPPILTVDGPIATIRMNRSAVHNSLEAGDLVVMRDLIDRVNADRAIRVLVLTGTGKTFCSGYNLKAFDAARDDRADFQAMTDEIERARPVVIARLNGPVYGGGTDLALACDFRIAVDHARMFMPAAKIGLHFYPHGLRRWVTRLGLGAAKRLFLTGQTIEAAEMLRIGFLDQIVPADQLDATVDMLATQIAGLPPRVIEGMKQVLNDVARQEFDDVAGQAAHEKSRGSRDMREAFAAMAEKRPPVFTGE